MSKIKKIKIDGHKMCLVTESEEKKKRIKDSASHCGYCLNRSDINFCTGAGKEMCLELKNDKIKTVLEPFGGSGWHTLFIQKIIKPKLHLVLDISQGCVDSIEKSLKGPVVLKKDSFKFVNKLKKHHKFNKFDFIHADFNNYTFNKYLKLKSYRKMINSIFQISQDAVTLTDSAIYGLIRFKKNFGIYDDFFKMKMNNYEDYYKATADYYYEKYGFGLRKVIFWGGNAAMLLLRKDKKVKYKISKQQKRLNIEFV